MTHEKEYNIAFANYLNEIATWYRFGLAKTENGLCPIASHFGPKIDQAIKRDDQERGYAAKFLTKITTDLERIRNERINRDKTQLQDGERDAGSGGYKDAGENAGADDRQD